MVTEFTPLASLFGGSLIGISAVILMLSLGRVMGATGILAGALMPGSWHEWVWRALVLAGMVTGPWLFKLITGSALVIDIPVSSVYTMLGGLIVGVGVTLGSGCTSGHGICGLSRFSTRSLVAVLVFMASTGLTVFVMRHMLRIG